MDREPNPAVTLIAGVAMAVAGIGSFAVARVARGRALEEGEPTAGTWAPRPQAPGVQMVLHMSPGQQAGGGPAGSTPSDERTMRTPGIGFTTWFTLETENEVVSRLRAWKNSRGIPSGGCEQLSTYDPMFGVRYQYQSRQAAEAAQDVLEDLYPTGRPWTPDPRDPLSPIYGLDKELVRIWKLPTTQGPADWRKWLFMRAYYLALTHVCDYVPVI